MIFLYRIRRAWLTASSMVSNRLMMALSSVVCGSGFSCCGSILWRNYAGHGGIKLGHRVSINSHRLADPIGGDTRTIIVAGSQGHIILHDGVSISNSTLFSAQRIEIGEDTCIGGGCKIYDTDFHSVNAEKRLNNNRDVPIRPVVIGKRVFIGGHTLILKGVTIGDEAVIGAGSIVTRDVPVGEIWAGNPARFIRKI